MRGTWQGGEKAEWFDLATEPAEKEMEENCGEDWEEDPVYSGSIRLSFGLPKEHYQVVKKFKQWNT